METGSTICVRIMFLETEVSRADSWEEMMDIKYGEQGESRSSILEPVAASQLHTSSFDDGGDMKGNPVPFVMELNTPGPGV